MIMLSSLLDKELHLFVDGLTAWAALELPKLIGGALLMIVGWWNCTRPKASSNSCRIRNRGTSAS
jgi:hypothetical protein